jgi:WD40 repeat protein
MDERASSGFSAFAPPIANFGPQSLSWSCSGLVALGAGRSILIYHATRSVIRYCQTLSLSKANPTCVLFQPEKAILAIADDNHDLSLWNAETSELEKHTNVGDTINAIGWNQRVVIILKKSRTIHAWDSEGRRPLWKVDLDSEFTSFSVDPFSPFRLVLTSPHLSAFGFLSAVSVSDRPELPIDTRMLSGNSLIKSSLFHPHIPGLVLLVLSSQVMVFDIATTSLTSLVRDERATVSFRSVGLSSFDISELVVEYSDGSLTLFRGTNQQCALKFKRVIAASAAILSPIFPHRLLTYSVSNGLSLIKRSKEKAFIIHNVAFVPCSLTCFDCINDIVGIGTDDGQFWLIETGTSEVRLKIQLSKSPITRLRFQSDILFHFITDSDSGSFNIRTRELKRFRAAIDLFASDDLGILVHSSAALGLIQDGRERPVVLRQPMVAVVPQRSRTPTTCFGGDSPNFAICSATGTVFVYSSRSLKSVVSVRPAGFEALCAIAWNGNLLAVADEVGQIVIHDFMFQTEQRFVALPNIVKIEWTATDFFFLTKDGILARYRAK